MTDTSERFFMRATGRLACFTSPYFKVERVSFDVITPSAARGIFEAVLWKPAMRWNIVRIHVLNPVERISFRTNELNTTMLMPGGSKAAAAQIVEQGGTIMPFIAEDHRTQRNTLALRDVDYVLEARITLTRKAGPRDNHAKFAKMFQRRLDIGQHFQMPYFGMREFVADVSPISRQDIPPAIPETRALGWLVYDVDYSVRPKKAYVFHALMERGIINVPSPAEVFPLGSV